MMPAWMIVLAAFVVGTMAVIALVAGVLYLPGYLGRRRIEQRMRETTLGLDAAAVDQTLVKHEDAGPLPGLEHAIGRTSGGGALVRLIQQAGVHISITAVIFLSFACAIALAFVTSLFLRVVAAPVIAGLIGLVLPIAVLRHRRTVRMKRFEEQFPDALDLLSRAIRAGHAFATAMGMVASEGPDPTGPEFKKTFDEQNFGLPMKDALNGLATRVPLLDVRFFVTAVLIQRETGGTLAEILDNLSYVVRERFKVLRQVRVHTAHGRFTGYVLIALPAGLAIVLMFINPEHMGLLFKERMGQAMLTVAVVLQIIGYIWIKRVVKIEV